MDVPGPSSMPFAIVQPATVYHPTPQRRPFVLPTSFSLPRPTTLIRSSFSAFKEVNELKSQVSLLLPVLGPLCAQNSATQSSLAAAGLPQPSQALPALANSLMRKRPATTPNPECPVSIRAAFNACSLPSPMLNYWLIPPLRVSSPNAAAASIPAPSLPEGAPTSETAEQKWSNPSSVESNGQKTDSSTVSAGGDSGNIDIVGDGSESSTSSTSTQFQAMVTSPSIQQQFAQIYNAATASVAESKANFFYNNAKNQQENALRAAAQQQIPAMAALSATTSTPVVAERKHRKPVNDDIVKIIRQHDLSPASIAEIQIPVPKAIECDPAFRPVSEQQIIQQIVQGKKYEEMEVGECMIQLCKKLAEKRVFGPRLMSQTTVAGLNHSNYSNLPIKGICYIQHVCRQVLGTKITSEEDFWDKFREAMRKLAARCRRVRHAKKTKNKNEENLLATSQELAKCFGEDVAATSAASFSHTMQTLGLNTNGLIPRKADAAEAFSSVFSSEAKNLSVGDLILLQANLAASDKMQKPFKSLDESNAMTTLLNMANNCAQQAAFKIESEPLSP
ncbi:unnamed protein product [Caenorhabditis auriculariae]|uniref:Protein lin-14 n=1 Tax=Caenorhabditis auriculariae TaxID=2777116 RepID=A0A8S1H2P2_9PELO|nr:unnamed protein product [Caenorhabditis auriculariae]